MWFENNRLIVTRRFAALAFCHAGLQKVVFSPFFREKFCLPPLFPFPCLSFSLFTSPPIFFLSSLIFRPNYGLPLGKEFTQGNPLAVVENFMQQPNLICSEFRFDYGCRVWSFLPTAPTN